MSDLVAEYRRCRKYEHLVVLTRDARDQTPLAEHCYVHLELDDALVARTPRLNWVSMIEASAAGLFLEVTALDSAPALAGLGAAVLEVGNVLVVVDEAQQVVGRRTPPQMLQVWTRGRKRGINVITVTQSLKQRPVWGLHPTIISESTALVTFLKSDPNEQQYIVSLCPAARDLVGQLRTPRDGTPEYVVSDLVTGRTLAVLRDGEHDISVGSDDSWARGGGHNGEQSGNKRRFTRYSAASAKGVS